MLQNILSVIARHVHMWFIMQDAIMHYSIHDKIMQIKNMKTIEHDVAYELSLQIMYDTKNQKQ